MPTRTPFLRPSFPLSCALAGCLLALGVPARAISPFPERQAKPATSSQPPSTSFGVFPFISAEALDKSQITLPSQLEGKQNLMLLSWRRDQATQLDTWTAVAQALQHVDFDFRVYHILVSAPENALFRWWDNASLRAAETDPELLHWSVPIYTEKSALRQSLGVSDDEHAVVAVLVDRAGRVLWKAQGPSTAASRASLLEAAHAVR